MAQRVSLWIEPKVLGLPPTHAASLTAMEDFIAYVHESPDVDKLPEFQHGTAGAKGSWEQIVLSVGSPAAIVAICRLWLQRDRKRSLHVKLESNDLPSMEITVEGDNISLKSLEQAIESSLRSANDNEQIE